MPSADDELSQLRRAVGGAGGRPYLGTTSTGGLALAEPQQALLILGPPRSGKTTALVIPNVLAAPGPVVATSTKLDVLSATLAERQRVGRCWLLDPTGTVRVPLGVTPIRWSPVCAAARWDDSLVSARAMVGASRPQARAGEAAHWTERAEALLAPLLHAAACAGGDMALVTGWVLRQDLTAARAILTGHGASIAADVLAGIHATDGREQSGIWSTTAGVLAAYRSEAVLASAAEPNFDPATLIDGKDTVYICAPSRYQDLVAPIVVAFLEQARAGAYAAAGLGVADAELGAATDPGAGLGAAAAVPSTSAVAAAGASRPAPLTLVLDELANIAPLPDLPALVSEGGGQGVVTVAALQDLSQARERWGRAADGFLSLFGAKVVLPGIGDLATLELVSRLAGEVDVPTRSESRSPWWSPSHGAPTVTWATRRQRRLPVDEVSQQPRGTAIVLVGARPPERIRLPPWWATPVIGPAVAATAPEATTARSRAVPALGTESLGPVRPARGADRPSGVDTGLDR